MISIIGGSGFIGSSLARRLSEQQLNFLICDLQKSESFCDKSSILDVRSIKDLRSKLQGNVAVNLAAIHRDNIPDPDEYYSTNVEGARALCQVCEEKGINKIVFTSSVAVYGFAPSEQEKMVQLNH